MGLTNLGVRFVGETGPLPLGTENSTVMCCLMMGIHSEKCVIRQFLCCVNMIECAKMDQPTTHLGCMAEPIAPRLQTCTACYCSEHCRQL